MHNVYKNSLLNIAAMASHNIQGGLFRSRNQADIKPCIVRADWTMETGAERECFVLLNEFWPADVSNAPLNTRGWVLQERLLAPRLLHFGEERIFWEYRELAACETYPAGISEYMVKQDIGLNAIANENVTSEGKGKIVDSPSESTYYLWDKLVEVYSRCQLTKEEDKLIAISGLARQMKSLLGDTYLAGLF